MGRYWWYGMVWNDGLYRHYSCHIPIFFPFRQCYPIIVSSHELNSFISIQVPSHLHYMLPLLPYYCPIPWPCPILIPYRVNFLTPSHPRYIPLWNTVIMFCPVPSWFHTALFSWHRPSLVVYRHYFSVPSRPFYIPPFFPGTVPSKLHAILIFLALNRLNMVFLLVPPSHPLSFESRRNRYYLPYSWNNTTAFGVSHNIEFD